MLASLNTMQRHRAHTPEIHDEAAISRKREIRPASATAPRQRAWVQFHLSSWTIEVIKR